MVIYLPPRHAELFQTCIDLIDSHNIEEDPKASVVICEKIFQDTNANIELLLLEPSCAVLALFGHVTLKDNKKVIARFERSKLPNWEDLKISESRDKLIQDLREKDDKLAKTVAMIAFCLSYADSVRCHENPIFRLNGAPQNLEEPVKEVGQEGEEDHDTDIEND